MNLQFVPWVEWIKVPHLHSGDLSGPCLVTILLESQWQEVKKHQDYDSGKSSWMLFTFFFLTPCPLMHNSFFSSFFLLYLPCSLTHSTFSPLLFFLFLQSSTALGFSFSAVRGSKVPRKWLLTYKTTKDVRHLLPLTRDEMSRGTQGWVVASLAIPQFNVPVSWSRWSENSLTREMQIRTDPLHPEQSFPWCGKTSPET